MKTLRTILIILITFCAAFSSASAAVEINMPEPDAFPEALYLLELTKMPDLSALCDENQLLGLLGLDHLPADKWLSFDNDFLALQPYVPLNLEHAPYPIIAWISDDTLLTDAADGMWGHPWTPCQVSAALINAQLNKARDFLVNIGYDCNEPATLYRSVLSDGRPITEIGFPLMVEGLPLHASSFLAPGAYETSSGDWGYVTGDSAHIILLDNMEIYSLYLPEYVTVANKQPATSPIVDHQQALALWEANVANSFYQQQTVVVTSMRPCYLKHPIEGTNWRYIGRPAWEITYYFLDDGACSFFSTDYVDVLDGTVY